MSRHGFGACIINVTDNLDSMVSTSFVINSAGSRRAAMLPLTNPSTHLSTWSGDAYFLVL